MQRYSQNRSIPTKKFPLNINVTYTPCETEALNYIKEYFYDFLFFFFDERKIIVDEFILFLNFGSSETLHMYITHVRLSDFI